MVYQLIDIEEQKQLLAQGKPTAIPPAAFRHGFGAELRSFEVPRRVRGRRPFKVAR